MRRNAAAGWLAALMLPATVIEAAEPDDTLEALEREERTDLERLRRVNTGAVQFLNEPPAAEALHTDMTLSIDAQHLSQGWVEMRQCQRGLDALASSEIIYRYADMRDLRVTSVHGIDAARVEGQSIQLSGVRPGAEICAAAQVRILRELGQGRYGLVSGPFHRRFFDGYFPMRLTLNVHYPAERLRWHLVKPAAQPGFTVSEATGLLAIDTHFTGILTIELEFVRAE